ncbi:MAG TPA: hypothetical protein VIH48_03675 [Candidatus Bathyarchaeia archaeon]
MNAKLARATALVLIAVFAACLGGIYILGNAVNQDNANITDTESEITQEEAIEISKNATLVKEAIATAKICGVGADYYNSSMLEKLREWHSDELFKNVPKDEFWEEKLPQGHTAWEIEWGFGYLTRFGGYIVIVVVDATTGTIIEESRGIELL